MAILDQAERWRQLTPHLKILEPLEMVIAGITMFLFSQGLIGPLLMADQDTESPILRLMWPPVYLLVLLLMACRPSQIMRALAAGWPWLGLAALCILSMTWSLDPGISLRRGIAILFTSMFGIWLAGRFTWAQLLEIIAVSFLVQAVLSFLISALVPSLGVMHEIHVGAWKGIWWEKNTLGSMMAWGTLSMLAAAAANPKRRLMWWGLAPLPIFLVLMSTSKTGLLACMMAICGPIAIALVRRGMGFAGVAIFGVLMVGSIIVFALIAGPVAVLEALGRDATLTGRTDIWAVLIDMIKARPWTGYGYGAFWVVEDGPVHWVRVITAWPVPTAHNAWLETALAIGLPGVILAAFGIFRAFGQAVLRIGAGVEAFWALPFFVVWLMVSLTESTMLQQNSLSWSLLIATATKLNLGRACA